MKAMTLPKLPPLRPETESGGPDLSEVVEMINASIPPIPSSDWADPVRVKFKCATCGELKPWNTHHWGSWDTGETRPILVKRRDGNGFAMIRVPVRAAGRTCTSCTMDLVDWRKSKEPDVSVLRTPDGKQEGSRAPKRGKRDKSRTAIWRTWYAVTGGMKLEAK